MADNQFVKTKMDEGVLILTIDNPPVNVLNKQTLAELDKTIADAQSDSKVKVIVITGAGSMAFIAGADIKIIASVQSKQEAVSLALQGQAVLDKIEASKKPVIAAINAVCLGGGNELAMACHIRIASDRAKFGQPEVSLGIVPGFGGSQRLARYSGVSKALELCLTGDLITAQEALRINLINRVVPDGEVLKQAVGMAKRIASKGQVAVRLITEAVVEGIKKPLSEGLKLEAEQFGKVSETSDMKEGVRAFLEKRQPKFEDK